MIEPDVGVVVAVVQVGEAFVVMVQVKGVWVAVAVRCVQETAM